MIGPPEIIRPAALMACLLAIACDGHPASPVARQPAAPSRPSSASDDQRPGTEDVEPTEPLDGWDGAEAALLAPAQQRDPFAPLPQLVGALLPPFIPARREAVLGQFSLDELRLIAIISSDGSTPRAMLVVPDGQGQVVGRGDYLGRGEPSRRTPAMPGQELSWRVARVGPDRGVRPRPTSPRGHPASLSRPPRQRGAPSCPRRSPGEPGSARLNRACRALRSRHRSAPRACAAPGPSISLAQAIGARPHRRGDVDDRRPRLAPD